MPTDDVEVWHLGAIAAGLTALVTTWPNQLVYLAGIAYFALIRRLAEQRRAHDHVMARWPS